MEDKIYQKLKDDEKEMAQHYFKILGIEGELENTLPKKNIDLEILLKRLNLIDEDSSKLDEINEFHDYLFKYGIEIGIGNNKKLLIESIQNGNLDFDELKKIDPAELVNYKLEPTFIHDMKEAIINEK